MDDLDDLICTICALPLIIHTTDGWRICLWCDMGLEPAEQEERYEFPLFIPEGW